MNVVLLVDQHYGSDCSKAVVSSTELIDQARSTVKNINSTQPDLNLGMFYLWRALLNVKAVGLLAPRWVLFPLGDLGDW